MEKILDRYNFLNPIKIIENDIVRLGPLQESDFERLYNVGSDPEIWAGHPAKDRYQKDIFEKYFQGAIESETAYLIIDKIKNQVIGTSRFYEVEPEDKSVAIGYTFLAKSYWGTGYNSIIKRLMLETAFQEVDQVIFHVGAENIISQKAVLKLGAKLLKIDDFESSGKKEKYHFYIIEKKDF
jgi:RimJ/RimL family protein N-acetyltransferase